MSSKARSPESSSHTSACLTHTHKMMQTHNVNASALLLNFSQYQRYLEQAGCDAALPAAAAANTSSLDVICSNSLKAPHSLSVDLSSTSLLYISLISLLPLVFGIVSSFRRSIGEYLASRWSKLRHEQIRTIEYVASTDYHASLRADNRNNILQKAIMFHISDRKVFDYDAGNFMLIEPGERMQDRNEKRMLARTCDALRTYRLATMPAMNVWQEVEDGLWFHQSEFELPGGEVNERLSLITYKLKTSRRNGQVLIDEFLHKCLKEYTEILKTQEDTSRYMYQMLHDTASSLGNTVAPKPHVFKRYKLNEEKTFESLFFPNKNDMLALVDDFLLKRGKFGVEGFPQKLGLLLHGPPGTGKTSFVKALATYTNRHIVSVPLAKLNTNQELYDIMFERVFPCLRDGGVAQRLDFSDIIFLIEEIDVACDIVRSRQAESAASALNAEVEGSDGAAGALQSASMPFDDCTSTSVSTLLSSCADKLDLAGLLNVMDGVVDSPGRIVIMTTNHPEKLDAALIRPGRINNRLLFTFMREQEMLEMLSLHYGALSAQDAQTLHDILVRKNEETLCDGDDSGFCITPAEVEQLCSEADELEDFFASLRAFPELGAVQEG